jgi:hypothetical protein
MITWERVRLNTQHVRLELLSNFGRVLAKYGRSLKRSFILDDAAEQEWAEHGRSRDKNQINCSGPMKVGRPSIDAVARRHDIFYAVDPDRCSGARHERAAKY